MADTGVATAGGGDVVFLRGQRVHVVGNPRRTGTVRYVGALPGYPGEWVGVDWDDGEGKHDGSVDGVRYFVTAGERSASFVRPRALSAGIALTDAIRLRYSSDPDVVEEEKDEMYVLSTTNRHVSVEFVGKDKAQEKLKNLEELNTISVSFMGVSSVGPKDKLRSLVPNIKELDLTGNLISKWQEVSALCEALPSLQVLDLTSNIMDDESTDIPYLHHVLVLVLNKCNISWELVEKLKLSSASVEELHLLMNKLTTIGVGFTQGFSSLQLLNLEGNCIESWGEILKLSYLKRLRELHLNKNKIKHVIYPCNQTKSDHVQDGSFIPFEKLECLLLGCNEIGDLASVDSLNLFPSLTDIRLSDNPVADTTKGGVPRFVLVARLAKVRILNGSEVSQRERKEAEIRYVRLVMTKMPTNDPEEMKRLHPRFQELKLHHGIEDEKPLTISSGPQKMSSVLISVTLKCVGASMGEKQPLMKKLPPTTTIGKLKVLCESFFKLKDVKVRLFLQEEGSPMPQLLDDDLAALADIGLGTEPTILVDEGG